MLIVAFLGVAAVINSVTDMHTWLEIYREMITPSRIPNGVLSTDSVLRSYFYPNFGPILQFLK